MDKEIRDSLPKVVLDKFDEMMNTTMLDWQDERIAKVTKYDLVEWDIPTNQWDKLPKEVKIAICRMVDQMNEYYEQLDKIHEWHQKIPLHI
jgi:hypothetical protein